MVVSIKTLRDSILLKAQVAAFWVVVMVVELYVFLTLPNPDDYEPDGLELTPRTLVIGLMAAAAAVVVSECTNR